MSHSGLEALREEAASRTRAFTGRDAALARIDEWLDRDVPRVLLLVGDMGAGKSAIAGRLVEFALGDESPPPGLRRLGPGCVAGAHFCSGRLSESLDPVVCARDLARQLAFTIPGFYAALQKTLSSLGGHPVSVNIRMEAGQAERMTAINNLTLHLGPTGGSDAFSRVLVDPLKELSYSKDRGTGFDRILLVVDALDEALRPSIEGAGIVEMLATSGGLPDSVRLLLTGRRGVAALDNAFPGAERLDISGDPELVAEGQRDARVFALRELRGALATRGLAEPEDLSASADRLVDRASANFQYLRFVIDAVLAGHETVSDLERIPRGLDGLYHSTLMRILTLSGRGWPGDHASILGVLAAAREPLPAVHLIGAAGLGATRFHQAIRELQQFIPGTQLAGELKPAYQFWHASVVEFLHRRQLRLVPPQIAGQQGGEPPISTEEVSNPFFLEPVEGHAALAEWLRQRWALGWTARNDGAPERYAFRNMIAHLIAASEVADPIERHRRIAELVSVVTDAGYHSSHLASLNDPAKLTADAMDAMRCASRDRHPEAAICLIRLAQDIRQLRKAHGDPEPIFSLARGGDPAAASRRLDLFPLEPAWRCIALCSLALAAANQAREAARKMLQDVAQTASRLGLSDEPPGQLSRVAEALLDGKTNPLPLPPPLPIDWSLEAQAREIVTAYGSGRAANISGLSPPQGPADGQPLYAAEQHGPLLIGYAVQEEVGGLNLLLEYIRILAANPYAIYRNRSLYILLSFIVSHPSLAVVREAVAAITGAVLAGGRLEFEESLPLAALGLLGREDAADEAQFAAEVAAARAAGRAEAGKGNREGDSWSRILRRLATLAEIRTIEHGARSEAEELIIEALSLPRGYAGYRAPACLALGESIRIVHGRRNHCEIGTALSAALQAAHNIQDADSCLITTARVNAMTQRWWAWPGGGDPAPLEEILPCSELLRDARARPETGALHRVGEEFKGRDNRDARRIDDPILQARTPAEIASIFHCHPDDLRILNPGLPPDDVPVASGTEVSVPDVGMPPLISAHLAAELISAPPGLLRSITLQALVPAATGDATAADTVLARLLMAAAPAPPLDPAWRQLLRSIIDELSERRHPMDVAGQAYEFLD